MEGRLSNPRQLLEETVVRRVRENLSADRVYGEKSVTFGPFLEELHYLLKCKFVFIHRDGRDVVRSLMNWHNEKFGTIYREAADVSGISNRAVRNAGQLPIQHDTSDYSRPRPLPGTDYYADWEHFSRAKMCTYYWSRINDLYLDRLARLPAEAWISIDYTSPRVDDILKVAEFCKLDGLSQDVIEPMLATRVNSLDERGDISNAALYPDWRAWSSAKRDQFDEIAAETMGRLDYYVFNNSHWKPQAFGLWWRSNGGDADFYKWMYVSREKIHRGFLAWLASIEMHDRPINTIADYGCGLSIGYVDSFASRRYFGIDISDSNIDWCRRHYVNSNHTYITMDFVNDDLTEPTDLVFSMGTVDNAYDMDAFLTAMVRNSTRWIYVTAYRGWFPDLTEHRYQWNSDHQCFYNDISPHRVRRMLHGLGCTNIVVEPVPTGRSYPDARFETRVIARVPGARKEF